ncbi:MAG TPA: glycosyltransferase family 4 protein [Planctomycetota bacterium]|nr:glycosyltransferase family 4 protein [Planctomycetota bacterium]
MPTSLHLSTARSWRGGENQIHLLVRGLLTSCERAVVVAPPGSPLLARCVRDKIESHPIHVRAEWDIYGAWKLSRLLRKVRPDILHLHDGHAVLPGKMAARMAGLKNLKLVAHRRTVFKLKSKKKYGGRIDRVIAISRAVKDQLAAAGIPDEKIRVVYSGVEFPALLAADAPEVRALREKHAIPEAAFVLAHAAALTREKRQRDMIAAIAQASGTKELHLIIAGSGELRSELEAFADTVAPKRVHFLDFLNDLRPLWSMSSLAIYASEAEGLCTALIEAQGAGLPAIVSRAGGMVEVVEDNETGVIFNVGDTDALSRAILSLHDDPARRLRMGEKARVRARALFSAEAMVEGVAAVYRELTEE